MAQPAAPVNAQSSGSSWQTLKTLGRASLAVAKTVAVKAKDATVKTVNELRSTPTELKCKLLHSHFGLKQIGLNPNKPCYLLFSLILHSNSQVLIAHSNCKFLPTSS